MGLDRSTVIDGPHPIRSMFLGTTEEAADAIIDAILLRPPAFKDRPYLSGHGQGASYVAEGPESPPFPGYLLVDPCHGIDRGKHVRALQERLVEECQFSLTHGTMAPWSGPRDGEFLVLDLGSDPGVARYIYDVYVKVRSALEDNLGASPVPDKIGEL